MSMNLQLEGEDQALNSTINTTPLVDVMLVLLIIFLITVPVINKVVPVKLPDAANIATQTKPENIVIAVVASRQHLLEQPATGQRPGTDRQGQVEGNGSAPTRNPHPCRIRMPCIQSVGRVLYAIQRGGIVKVGFITQPDEASLAESIRNSAQIR